MADIKMSPILKDSKFWAKAVTSTRKQLSILQDAILLVEKNCPSIDLKERLMDLIYEREYLIEGYSRHEETALLREMGTNAEMSKPEANESENNTGS